MATGESPAGPMVLELRGDPTPCCRAWRLAYRDGAYRCPCGMVHPDKSEKALAAWERSRNWGVA
jgi:hypothetical protein